MSPIDDNRTAIEDREDDLASLHSRTRDSDCATEVALLKRKRDLLAREIDLMRRENELLRDIPSSDRSERIIKSHGNIKAISELLLKFSVSDSHFDQWEKQLKLLRVLHMNWMITRLRF